MKVVDLRKKEQILAEEKAEGVTYPKIVFHRKVEQKEEEEVSDTDSTYRDRLDRFADIFSAPECEKDQVERKFREAGQRSWHIAPEDIKRWKDKYGLVCHCFRCLSWTKTPKDSSVTIGKDPLQEDAGMSIFGCDFLNALNRYVVLPKPWDE